MNRVPSAWVGLILTAVVSLLLLGCLQAGTDPGENAAPALLAGGVDPVSGDPTTTFTYQVQYTDADGDAPVAIDVYIDGTAHGLTLFSGSAGDGVYTYQTMLAAGIHNSYFYCDDGSGGSARSPASGAVNEPTVTTPGNNSPVLSSDSVSPASGDTTTTFVFSVNYSDTDGDAPSAIVVYIDSVSNVMSLAAGSASSGTYEYSTTLSAGPHTYYLYCEDGNGGLAREPASGTTSGPAVTAAKNTLDGSVSYSGSETIGVTQPLQIAVWDWAAAAIVDNIELTTLPYDFSFDLDPGPYFVTVGIDMDDSGGATEDDFFVIYDGIHWLNRDLGNYDVVDLTSGGQTIAVALDDSDVYGFMEGFDSDPPVGWLPSDARWQVVNNDYLMVGNTGGDVAASVYDRNVQDFTFCVMGLEQLAGDSVNGGWGLLFRFDGITTTGYILGVSNDGWWGVTSLVNGVGTDVYQEQTFVPGDAVTVEMVGHTLTVYINEFQEWSSDLTAYGHTDGYVGVYALDDSGTGTDNVFSFDDAWLVLHP